MQSVEHTFCIFEFSANLYELGPTQGDTFMNIYSAIETDH
jgi:hypothetical protein